MTGLHIAEAPGFSGWTRLRDGTWKTMNRSEVQQMLKAAGEDITACSCSGTRTPVSHMTGHVEFDRHAAYSYQCASGSRWFNPLTRKMEGDAHCTCPRCWG